MSTPKKAKAAPLSEPPLNQPPAEPPTPSPEPSEPPPNAIAGPVETVFSDKGWKVVRHDGKFQILNALGQVIASGLEERQAVDTLKRHVSHLPR